MTRTVRTRTSSESATDPATKAFVVSVKSGAVALLAGFISEKLADGAGSGGALSSEMSRGGIRGLLAAAAPHA